jgi:hypothetical protein
MAITVVGADRAPPRMASVNLAPRGPLTYTPSDLPRSDITAYWVRPFRTCYLPRPWLFGVFALEPGRRWTDPWLLILRCAAATVRPNAPRGQTIGMTILARSLRWARRGREAPEMVRVAAG